MTLYESGLYDFLLTNIRTKQKTDQSHRRNTTWTMFDPVVGVVLVSSPFWGLWNSKQLQLQPGATTAAVSVASCLWRVNTGSCCSAGSPVYLRTVGLVFLDGAECLWHWSNSDCSCTSTFSTTQLKAWSLRLEGGQLFWVNGWAWPDVCPLTASWQPSRPGSTL